MERFKFLGAGRRHPLTGAVFPVDDWVRSDVTVVAGALARDGSDGVRCCDLADLANWVDAELWRVEVAGAATRDPYSWRFGAVRLLAPVERWTEAAARTVVAEAAWRARDQLADRLRDAGEHAAAGALRATTTIGGLGRVAATLGDRVGGEVGAAWRDPLGLLGEVADEAHHAPPAVALLTATVAIAGWDVGAQAGERRWQSTRIAAVAGLAG